MTTRIKYNASTPHGQLLAEGIDSLIAAREKIGRVLKAANAMAYGSPQDNTSVEAELGLDPGKAPDVLFALQSISDALNGATLLDITAQYDQG